MRGWQREATVTAKTARWGALMRSSRMHAGLLECTATELCGPSMQHTPTLAWAHLAVAMQHTPTLPEPSLLSPMPRALRSHRLTL